MPSLTLIAASRRGVSGLRNRPELGGRAGRISSEAEELAEAHLQPTQVLFTATSRILES
jgi:hypothetical protein